MKIDNAYRLSICGDCLHHLANGECGNCHEEHDREPLCIIPETDNVTLGLLQEDHAEGCEFKAAGVYSAGHECDCENLGFSWQACDACGSTLGGDRFAAVGWAGENV